MTNPPPPSILVLGAGELGTAVLSALASHPRRRRGKISMLLRPSRDPEKLRSLILAPPGSDNDEDEDGCIVPGDIATDPVDALAATFARFDAVVACAGFAGLPAGTQVRVAAAAVRAGVGRFFPWQWGVDYDVVGRGSAQDLFDEQLEVRRVLREQEGPGPAAGWTVVSTGLFMSFLFLPEFGAVDLKNRTVRALGSWDTRITVTTPRDIGRVVAEMVYGEEQVPDGVVYVAGDTVSYGQVAELVERRFGGGFRREVWDLETLRGRLAERPDDGMVKYQNVFAEGRGVAWDKADTLNARRGVEMQDVWSYLETMADS